MIDHLSVHPIVADASLFGSYAQAIDAGLSATADDFWSDAFARTSS